MEMYSLVKAFYVASALVSSTTDISHKMPEIVPQPIEAEHIQGLRRFLNPELLDRIAGPEYFNIKPDTTKVLDTICYPDIEIGNPIRGDSFITIPLAIVPKTAKYKRAETRDGKQVDILSTYDEAGNAEYDLTVAVGDNGIYISKKNNTDHKPIREHLEELNFRIDSLVVMLTSYVNSHKDKPAGSSCADKAEPGKSI